MDTADVIPADIRERARELAHEISGEFSAYEDGWFGATVECNRENVVWILERALLQERQQKAA